MAGDPTLTSLDQISSTTVRVTWSPPSGGATVTGYVVHYRTGSSVRINHVSPSSTSTDITGLTIGATYTISVEATSQHLSGESEEMSITLREWIYSNVLAEFSAIPSYAHTLTTHTHMHTHTPVLSCPVV